MKTQYNTRALVESAIFASITVIIGVLTFYIPVFYFMSIFWVIPTVIISYKNGFKYSFISGIGASVILMMFIGPLSGLTSFIQIILPGIFFGYFLSKIKKQQNLIICSTAVNIICLLITFCLSAFIVGQDPVVFLNKSIDTVMVQFSASIDQAKTMYQSIGLSKEQIAMLSNMKEMLKFAKQLIIFALLLFGILSSLFNYWLTIKFLKRLKIKVPETEPLSEWHLTQGGLIGVSVLTMGSIGIVSLVRNEIVFMICSNMLYLLVYWFWFLGIATAAFYIKKNKLPKFLNIFVVFFSITNSILLFLFAIIGYVDAIFDFRKLRVKKDTEITTKSITEQK